MGVGQYPTRRDHDTGPAAPTPSQPHHGPSDTPRHDLNHGLNLLECIHPDPFLHLGPPRLTHSCSMADPSHLQCTSHKFITPRLVGLRRARHDIPTRALPSRSRPLRSEER